MPAQRRVIERALEDFRLAGVGLPPERKARYKAVVQELAQLGAKFEENVLDAMNAWTRLRHRRGRALPASIRSIVEQARVRAAEKGLHGLAVRARAADLRRGDHATRIRKRCGATSTKPGRRAHRIAARTRASSTTPPVMAKILALRHEAAQLLDFPNYAAYALATRMAPSNQAVFDFLRQLVRVARPAAHAEFAELEQFAGRKLNAWDVGYYAEKHAGEAVLHLAGRAAPLFPAAARARRPVRGRRAAVRREDRRAQRRPDVSPRRALLRDRRCASGKVRAGFYLDACARAEETRRRVDGRLRRPQGFRRRAHACRWPTSSAISCRRRPGKPALLTHDDVVTMFHEFGHGLHHMLTRVGYPSIAGINGVSWDAVELPSQFIENFAWRPEVLATMARHFETGAPLPAEQQKQLLGSRTFHAGLATMRQLEFALFDFRLHAEYDPARGARIDEILARGARRGRRVRRCPSGTASRTTSATSSPAVTPRVTTATSGPRCSPPTRSRRSRNRACSTARWRSASSTPSFRAGGSRKALDAFVDFRGRPPDVNALLRQQGLRPVSRRHRRRWHRFRSPPGT